MNRDLTHAGGRDGRAASIAQTRAVHRLMQRIRLAHPDVEIETCSSGGGRADYGMLATTHRIWVSDCTDALERIEIQRGAELFLPPEILGCHISNSPGHQTGRQLSLSLRSLEAMPGHLGVELNPLGLDEAGKTELAGIIALHKRLRPVLHGRGQRFRQRPVDGRHVYGVIAADRSAAVVTVAQATYGLSEQPQRIRIPHLDPGGRYRLVVPMPQRPLFLSSADALADVLEGKTSLTGEWLGEIGLFIPHLAPDSALLIELERLA